MASTFRAQTKQLQAVEQGCCPLCQNKLPIEGILYTPDFEIFVRDGQVAQFSWGQAALIRALFGQHQNGFRMERERLLDKLYPGSKSPLTAAGSLSTAIQQIRPKLLPLGMGIMADNGMVNLLFTPPGYRRR